MSKGKTFGLLLLLFVLFPVMIYADLKDYIMIVKPIYHDKTRDLFYDLADHFSKQGQEDLNWYFTNLAEEHGHGTGWVIVDEDGENYIVTNMHVVNQADTVNLYFENPDGSQRPYYDCPILYVDNYMDLAVCQFPGGQRVFEVGWEMDTSLQKDLTQVISAGFPGFGSEPLWQVAIGNISNAQARVDPNYDYWIQHSAPIDPGNSGGPLLVADPASELGYKVVGVNTWKASSREATNFSIPTRHVVEVLEKAKKFRALKLDEELLRSELERNCKILASELGSEHPEYERVSRYISYAYVGEQGWPAILTTLNVTHDQQRQEWNDYFFDDPVEAMRSAIYWLFWTGLHSRGDVSSIEFKEINFTDNQEIGKKTEIRTNFMIDECKTEIVWTLEYGDWKISNMDLPEFSSTAAAATSGKGGLLYGVSVGLGAATALGDDVYLLEEHWPIFSWYAHAFIEYQLYPAFYLHTGLGLTQSGLGWTYEFYDATYGYEWLVITEKVYHLIIPVMLKVYMPGGFFLGFGAGLDIVLFKDESYRNSTQNDAQWISAYFDDEDLYFSELGSINVSVLLNTGFIFSLGASIMGVEVIVDYHLLNDWGSSFDQNYLNTHLGVFFLF